MSIKIMSAIFETEFRDLPMPEPDSNGKQRHAKASSMKIVLLALADHANDDGECWPGYSRLELKTGLSRQGIADVLSAITHNGLAFIADEPSKKRTNYYTINLNSFPQLRDKEDKRLLVKPLDESSHLTNGSQATLPEVVKPLDLNHHITTKEPPSSSEMQVITTKANQLVDGMLEAQRVAQTKLTYPKRDSLPEPIRELIDAFVSATGIKPLGKEAVSWMSVAQDWLNLHVTAKDVTDTIEYAKGKFTVSTPHSLTNTLRARKASPDNSQPVRKANHL